MKRKTLVLTLLFFSFYSFCQSVKYIDENMKSINSLTYSKKCKSAVLKCLNFKTDSLNINKVVYKFKFGKVSKTEYSQVRKLLIKSSRSKIRENTVLMIKYSDTIYDSHTIKKNFERHVMGHDSVKHKDFNPKRFHSDRKKWIKGQEKCKKKFQKFGAKLFYVYNYDYGYMKEYTDINWIKDRGLFKNAFFKIMYSGNFLLIKPNGEYFISGGHLPNKILKKLLKENNWSEYQQDWLRSYNSLSNSGKGIFRNNTSIYHSKHCF